MRESKVEKDTCCRAKTELGVKNLKLSGPHDRGKSDRMFFKNRVVVFVEFKRKGKEPTPLQNKFLEERREDGFEAEWFDDTEECLKWLAKIFQNK